MKKKFLDIPLLIIICLLVVIGFLALATTSIPLSLEKTGTSGNYLIHQIIFGLIPGVILCFVAYKLPLLKLKRFSFIFFILSYLSMFAVFIPGLSISELGATRWVDLGFFSFQPSELLKLAVIFYLATILNDEKNRKKFFVFALIVALVCIALILQKDLGTLFVIFSIMIAMFFCSNTPFKQTMIVGITAVISFVVLIILTPYRMKRIFSFLNPEEDVLGSSYHINQALISVGSGGLTGSGLGLSMQKLGFLPQSISDSIFAILAEEIGFIGCFFLIAIFLAFFVRALSISKLVNNQMLKLMAIGIGTWIIIQAFVNMGSMIGLSPLTGIPLPFISYGGTHLIIELIACGLLLNISKEVKT